MRTNVTKELSFANTVVAQTRHSSQDSEHVFQVPGFPSIHPPQWVALALDGPCERRRVSGLTSHAPRTYPDADG